VLESLFDAGFYLEATYPIRSDETKGDGEFGSQQDRVRHRPRLPEAHRRTDAGELGEDAAAGAARRARD
jgi:hypothetical protein